MFDLIYSIVFLILWWLFCKLLLGSATGYLPQTQKQAYNLYMASAEWKNKRKHILSRDNYKCTKCGSSNSLHIHHLTYAHFTKELDHELITLCHECHQKVHGRKF